MVAVIKDSDLELCRTCSDTGAPTPARRPECSSQTQRKLRRSRSRYPAPRVAVAAAAVGVSVAVHAVPGCMPAGAGGKKHQRGWRHMQQVWQNSDCWNSSSSTSLTGCVWTLKLLYILDWLLRQRLEIDIEDQENEGAGGGEKWRIRCECQIVWKEDTKINAKKCIFQNCIQSCMA